MSSDPGAFGSESSHEDTPMNLDVAALVPLIRRVVGARVSDPADVEDLTQEAIARILASADRIGAGMAEPYAIATARNLVASTWRSEARLRQRLPRLHEPGREVEDDLEGRLLATEDRAAMRQALSGFDEEDRDLLLAHEVHRRSTVEPACARGSTPAAVAARLYRLRARLRVEYLLAERQLEPPTDRCRPVLLALSGRNRRRQRETDAERHLLRCPVCREVSGPLLADQADEEGLVTIPIAADADVVRARQAAREVAGELGFSQASRTTIATAVSETVRNIVKFAGRGVIAIETVTHGRQRGIRVVARDAGPGIADLDEALRDGYSTYHGLGIGLPGARRLMDEFEIVTEPGKGTTVTMTAWLPREAR